VPLLDTDVMVDVLRSYPPADDGEALYNWAEDGVVVEIVE